MEFAQLWRKTISLYFLIIKYEFFDCNQVGPKLFYIAFLAPK